jgi:hypothetical protein
VDDASSIDQGVLAKLVDGSASFRSYDTAIPTRWFYGGSVKRDPPYDTA